MGDGEDSGVFKTGGKAKFHNVLPIWGNDQTMNLNPLVLANIQGSCYFKVHLFKLKTYHEVVDEIYYQVKHLEPWERGSRKTAGQTGMCGGVRGVGAGGIVSTAYCLLYKLYTLRLTRKQVNGLLQHTDSPFIRALGFMYIRYTQPPADLFDWYEEYLEDEEEIDAKAGGGQPTTIGALVRQMLIKLDWFSTLFPRIPVPIQKQIEQRLAEHNRQVNTYKPKGGEGGSGAVQGVAARGPPPGRDDRRGHDDRVEKGDSRSYSFGEAEKYSRERQGMSRRNEREDRDRRDKDKERGKESCKEKESYRDKYSRDAYRERERDARRDAGRHRDRSRSRDRQRDRSRDRRHR